MSSIFTEPSDTARAESPEAVQTYLIDLESENAALQDQLTEAKAVSDRWQKDCRWYQEEYADCATELKEAKATIAEMDRRVIDLEKDNCQQQALMQQAVDTEMKARQQQCTHWASSAIDDMARHLEK